jgi:hypothetical protein
MKIEVKISTRPFRRPSNAIRPCPDGPRVNDKNGRVADRVDDGNNAPTKSVLYKVVQCMSIIVNVQEIQGRITGPVPYSAKRSNKPDHYITEGCGPKTTHRGKRARHHDHLHLAVLQVTTATHGTHRRRRADRKTNWKISKRH